MPSEITMSSVVVAITDQLSRRIEDEVVILDLKAGAYYGLNAVGLAVWRLVQEPRRVAEIRDAILDEFDVAPAQCEADVLRLLQEMADTGLIHVATS